MMCGVGGWYGRMWVGDACSMGLVWEVVGR